MTSIFFLTSIFNHSIQSSIAVFYLRPHIHEKWKGRIETWQLRKRQRRRAQRKSNSSSAESKNPKGTRKRPLSFLHGCLPGHFHQSPALPSAKEFVPESDFSCSVASRFDPISGTSGS